MMSREGIFCDKICKNFMKGVDKIQMAAIIDKLSQVKSSQVKSSYCLLIGKYADRENNCPVCFVSKAGRILFCLYEGGRK